MAVGARLRSAVRSDTGRRRTNNEDRYYVDAERGIFAVIDGVGGHAAGEHAAEAAVEVLRERLERQTGTPEERLREAIALANNEIYRRARSRPEWNGMACVLTIALIEDDVVTVGHVGDSRLYLLRPGEIRKMTHDHSPVGEREDRGEISEAEAMKHARRNEIYRDVGSLERSPDDPSFIEITSFPMPPDSVILLCSDGLTDLIAGPEIRACLERYAPDYEAAIRALIDAANNAGGKDNITVVIVAGPEYKRPADKPVSSPAPDRALHRRTARRWPMVVAGAFAGIAVGVAVGLLFPYVRGRLTVTGPKTLTVGPAGINAALSQAHPGDTVVIPEGKYKEQIQLREGVALRSQQPADVTSVTLTSPDGGPVVIARSIDNGSIEGVWIQGDMQAPGSAGIQVIDASPAVSNVRITGMLTGVEIRGASAPRIASSQIENNLGAGIEVHADAKPKIENNVIAANGNGKPGLPKPGVEVGESARPVLKDNAIVNNGAEPIWVHGHISPAAADFEENFFGEMTPKRAVRLIDEPAGNEKSTVSEKKGKGRPVAKP
jgi:PPM family protein phosphatase